MPRLNNNASLAMMSVKFIPEYKADAKKITALVRKQGRVVGYQLSDGTILNKDQAVKECKAGNILGVGISERNGNEYLKSIPDGQESNNLTDLPSISN